MEVRSQRTEIRGLEVGGGRRNRGKRDDRCAWMRDDGKARGQRAEGRGQISEGGDPRLNSLRRMD